MIALKNDLHDSKPLTFEEYKIKNSDLHQKEKKILRLWSRKPSQTMPCLFPLFKVSIWSASLQPPLRRFQAQTHRERERMSSGRQSQSWRPFVRMGCGVAPEDIKQRSRRCCYRWVARSWLWFGVCVYVWRRQLWEWESWADDNMSS